MSKATDPALYESDFDLIDGDRYWTSPWVTSALIESVDFVDPLMGPVWEPAAGRGDMVDVLLDHGFDVLASDVDMSEFDATTCDCEEMDFLGLEAVPRKPITGIVTNPPYVDRKAETFVRRAVSYLEDDRATYVAMLLRSEFRSGSRRADLFGRCPYYAGELVLTTRPRWDWWFREHPKASPRHNFSWFLWHRSARDWSGEEHPAQIFHYKGKR